VTETCDSTGPNNRTKYIYDGSGQRVQKVVGGGLTTTYVYGAAGDLTSEFVSGTPPSNPCTTCYIVSDTLGSTRLMMDASSGSIVALHDYLPFGEEISGSPVRPGTLYGGTDNPRQKFTGKERDSETGLDFFGARYYSGSEGRFTSPDPKVIGRAADPQQWNKYIYARNSPFLYVDPDGRDIHIVVTNQTVGTSYVKKYTSKEMRNDPTLQQVRESGVPTYRVLVRNDSGSGFMTQVTRDTNRNGPTSETRGNFGSGNEAPPGSYAAAIRTGGDAGFRVELRDPNNPSSATIQGPDGDRLSVQIHIGPGCSEGCMLLQGGQQGRSDFQSQMDVLKAEDAANGNGTDIDVLIVPRNARPIPSDIPSQLDLPSDQQATQERMKDR